MSSSTPAINRRTIVRIIKKGDVKGTNPWRCAMEIGVLLRLHPSCTRKVHEAIETCLDRGLIVFENSKPRVTTEEERAALQEARTAEVTRTRRTLMRTAAKRSGGHKTLAPIGGRVLGPIEDTELHRLAIGI